MSELCITRSNGTIIRSFLSEEDADLIPLGPWGMIGGKRIRGKISGNYVGRRITGQGKSDNEIRILLTEVQGNFCEACADRGPMLVIDHDHQSDMVRGLLCYSCNTCEGQG